MIRIVSVLLYRDTYRIVLKIKVYSPNRYQYIHEDSNTNTYKIYIEIYIMETTCIINCFETIRYETKTFAWFL